MAPGLGKRSTVLRLGIGVLITAAFVSGCTTLGPDYEEPEIEWLADWQTDLYGQVAQPEAQTEVDLSFWWQLFDDPVLNGLVDLARENNLSLQQAGLRILESRAALGIATSNRYPQVQQVTGAVTYVASGETGSGSSGSDSLTDYQAGFGLGWELDFWGRFKRGIESADAAYLASITNYQDVQVLLSAQVADLYYGYLTAHLRIVIARQNAEIQKRSYEITEELFNSGQDSELDLQQAKTQYLATLSAIPELEITLINVRNALSVILGRPPGELPEMTSMPTDLPVVEPVVIQDIPARLLVRRPDIRTAAWQVAAQSAQIGIARADYYPAISLFGTLGWSGDSLSGSPDIGTFAAGPAVAWNVFDYGRIGNNVRVQDARLQQAITNYQDRVLSAAREIDNAAISIVKTQERKEHLSASVTSAQRSLELANTRYREGYADFQRVLDAQRSLFSQAERELINRGNHIGAIIDLYKAIGGGWLETPVDELIPEEVRETMRARSNWGELLDAPLPENVDGTP